MALRSISLSAGVAGTPCHFSTRQTGCGSSSTKRNVLLGSQQKTRLLRIRAQEDGKENAVEEAALGSGDDEDFEARLARLQRKVTSGTGKKAEVRKARKEGGLEPMTSSSSKPKDLFIPPVPLKDSVADGLVVEFGMKPYVERMNGRVAALGLAALLLVELATGDSLIKYHDSGTIFVQVYTVIGLAGLYAKFEKERISVWPK